MAAKAFSCRHVAWLLVFSKLWDPVVGDQINSYISNSLDGDVAIHSANSLLEALKGDQSKEGNADPILQSKDGREEDALETDGLSQRRLASTWSMAPASEITFVDDDPVADHVRGQLRFSTVRSDQWVQVRYSVYMVKSNTTTSDAGWTAVDGPIMQHLRDQAPGSTAMVTHYVSTACPPATATTTTTTATTATAAASGNATNSSQSGVATSAPTPAPTPEPRCGRPILDATHLLVRAEALGCNGSCAVAAASFGGRRLAAAEGLNFIVDRVVKASDRSGEAPNVVVQRASFVDENKDPGIIGGTVRITPPQPELGSIFGYRVYFYGQDAIVSSLLNGNRDPWLTQVTATGYEVEARIPYGTVVPGVKRLAVYAYSADGEASEGRPIYIYDAGSGTPESEVPVTEVIVLIVVFFVLITCGLCVWILLRLLRVKMDEEDARQEERHAQKDQAVHIAQQFCYLEKGESVEYWSFHRRKFLPGVVIDNDNEGLYSIRLEFGSARETIEKVPGSRLRRAFNDGEPVEVFFPNEGSQGTWVPAWVDGEQRICLYSVQFANHTGRPPMQGVLAHNVRSCYHVGEQVLVPWKAEWRLADIREVGEPQRDFPAQTLVCKFTDWTGLDYQDFHSQIFSAAVVKRQIVSLEICDKGDSGIDPLVNRRLPAIQWRPPSEADDFTSV